MLEEAASAGNPWLGIAAVFSAYDGLPSDPRFEAVFRERGLPNGSTAYRGSGT